MTQARFFPAAKGEADAFTIGIFDSGVGGLSIAKAVRQRLPQLPMLYVGDVAHSPYGERPINEVVERSHRITAWLIDHGACTIVVACNTATVLSIDALRSRWPKIVFVGVEPGVKPAAALTRTRRIAVMTTPATAQSARLRELINRHAATVHVHVQACEGLASAIERGHLDGEALCRVLKTHIEAIRASDVDTVVLGCTHYAFIDRTLRELLGDNVLVIDTAIAVAERIASLLMHAAAAEQPAYAMTRIFSTGATSTMHRLAATFLDDSELSVQSLDL